MPKVNPKSAESEPKGKKSKGRIVGPLPLRAVKDLSLDDVLRSIPAEPSKKKSTVPVLTQVSPEVKAKADRLIVLREQIDCAEGEFEVLKQEVVEVASPLREEVCIKRGYVSSVKIPTTDGQDGVNVTWTAKYKTIPWDRKTEIQNILGDRYDGFFAEAKTIVMKPEISMNTLMDFIKSISVEKFNEFFTVARSLVPTERYTKEFFSAFTVPEQANLRSMVEQYAPSLKAK